MNPEVVFWEVDAQADFILPEGKLYVPGAERRIPNIQRLAEAARKGQVFLISSADRHALDDPEFQRFPPHCVRGTPGAEILPELLAEKFLAIPNDGNFRLPSRLADYQQVILEKQTLDVFDNPNTGKVLERFGKQVEFVVFGVVTEFCVKCAAEGLLKRGGRVAIVTDAIESMDARAGQQTLQDLSRRGARLLTTNQALALLGHHSASPA